MYLYKLIMTDTGGDGWGDVTYTITTNGATRFTGSLEDGYRGTQYFCIEDNVHTIVLNGSKAEHSEICFEFDDTSGDAFYGCAPIVDVFHTSMGEVFGAPSVSTHSTHRLPPTTHRPCTAPPPPTAYRLPPTTRHAPPPTPNLQPPTTYHLPPATVGLAHSNSVADNTAVATAEPYPNCHAQPFADDTGAVAAANGTAIATTKHTTVGGAVAVAKPRPDSRAEPAPVTDAEPAPVGQAEPAPDGRTEPAPVADSQQSSVSAPFAGTLDPSTDTATDNPTDSFADNERLDHRHGSVYGRRSRRVDRG